LAPDRDIDHPHAGLERAGSALLVSLGENTDAETKNGVDRIVIIDNDVLKN
jgi:hypothetical protein